MNDLMPALHGQIGQSKAQVFQGNFTEHIHMCPKQQGGMFFCLCLLRLKRFFKMV